MKRTQLLVPKKCPIAPEGWDADRWRKSWENTRRAERLTGIVPFGCEGWEKVAAFLMDMVEQQRQSFLRGATAAAEIASTFDKQIDHPYRMDDVILCKLNLTKRKKPRRKR